MKKLRLLTLALLFHATSSWAMPMDYAFDIDWTDGSLSGTSSTVSVTLDELTGAEYALFTSRSASPRSIESFALIVYGTMFELGHERFSAVTALGFRLGGLDFAQYVAESFRSDRHVATFSVNAAHSRGLINFASFRSTTDGSVPNPTTLALFGLGLAGLRINRRKRKTRS